MAELHIRQMTPADIPFGMEMKTAAGWNQVESDWRAFLSYNPDGCFIAEWDGQPVGTTTTTIHDGKVAWIGMVLVHPGFRRLGIGKALLQHAIAWLQQRGVPCIKLDATPAGKTVYVPLGFRDEYELERVETVAEAGVGGQRSEVRIEAGGHERDAIRALDTEAFGVPRPAVLQRLLGEHPDLCWTISHPTSSPLPLSSSPSTPSGFLLARPGANAWHLGPWVARSNETAETLLRACLTRLAGQRVFADVPVNHPARQLVTRYGFKSQRPLTRMWLGCNDWPGNPALTYAVADPAKG
ncbi:MAG: GNAT family N-acetyltransferase [Verrucomicrobia bacterium]|nr:GNAT family N-acetyltransferase [Verrucomicrobiota bacterium]